MKFMVDGHNLIGKIPQMSLESLDDELDLISLLKRFCLASGKHRVDVYFDKAAPGGSRSVVDGPVNAHFVHSSSSADAVIEARLEKLGKTASEWAVVSSDRRVQVAARSVHAKVISSEKFVQLIEETTRSSDQPAGSVDESLLSSDELDEWLSIFRKRKQ